MAGSDTLKEQREYGWQYFQLHAGQRMSLFNFFVLISALLTTGLGGALGKGMDYEWIGLGLGLSLVLMSFVFWQLDQRVRYLIKHAEEALRTLEKDWLNTEGLHEDIALFVREETKAGDLVKNRCSWPWSWHLHYSTCFALVYIVFGAFGVLGAIWSIVKLVQN